MVRLKPSFWVFLISIALLSTQFGVSVGSQSTKQAYVTLLYGDEFLLGVRVLGKSIRDTGSKKDMVVLVSDGVSDYSKKLLKADGWKVEKISLLENPNQVHPKRFWGVYTKLKIFNMTEYTKVVYLDADTIVVKNIEDLFKCSKFCANLKHSERLNSGVMVVEPSEALFNDMMRQVKTLSSYTGGDQGFLNSYYPDFPNARVFDPSVSLEDLKTRPVPQMERLSTLYNADVGLYMLANKWMVDDSKLHVIHYTLGPLKPWDWWTAWLVKPVDAWQSIRVRLEESLPGTGGGKNPKDELAIKLLFLLPLCTLLICFYRFSSEGREFLGSLCRSSVCNQIRHLYYRIRSNGTLGYSGVSTLSSMNSNYQLHNGAHSKVPQWLGAVSVVVCFVAVLTSIGFSFAIVPRQIMPLTGLVLLYEWTFTLFFLLFGGFLLLVHQYGKRIATQTGSLSSQTESSLDDSGKGHQRAGQSCDVTTWYYGLGMVFLAIAAVSLPYILGISALFLRLGLMVAGAMVLASFMTYGSEHLAIRWFMKGLEDRDTTRTRAICFIC
ncbi:PREDICTED: inositol phosphorylceramide glucuronosyltransferase 1 [Tarenaya hassleriana]|uniref:inositol phosphorylceramide glucuronosyltransferase 1 n=1 Tax=Tarenaya hassleriana TaxID=28532 RepID=UPI00053C9247|nr:PREDICTED: inositol phosphorylceramide glucuronosyltransferase 1 [Tarenaya hassleriana]